ncbi:Nmad5 family putative nucleotide modification protein [Herminiimonas sp. CN]|uniref:Nmad5 family putative nucleotide modification protein n=1 Tax=Herminiimonas sp. CN TaxID=1349818 RepID=UPI00047390C6|nr:Nmad5 family putative nucleotide modification protein [Herminiimonas sp. CN]
MKLTKEHRQTIIEKCVKARFTDRQQIHEANRSLLGDALYEHAFGEGEKIAKKLPRGWVRTMSTVTISASGFISRYHHATEDELSPNLELSRDRLQPGVITDQFTVDETHPLYPQTERLVNEFNAIKADKAMLETQLLTLLYSVNTREKLMLVWPEGEEFFPRAVVKDTLPIPYDLTLSINRMMGLVSAPNGAL